jgi:hypothetical protein
MLVSELKNILDDGRINESLEVRIASQENYPFEYDIEGVAVHAEEGEQKALYLTEGEQIGYLDEEVWEKARREQL